MSRCRHISLQYIIQRINKIGESLRKSSEIRLCRVDYKKTFSKQYRFFFGIAFGAEVFLELLPAGELVTYCITFNYLAGVISPACGRGNKIDNRDPRWGKRYELTWEIIARVIAVKG